MSICLCTRDMVNSVPSTSGRNALAEALGRAAPSIGEFFARRFASLVGSGIPSPRPDVALQLSTPHGGHINRMINTSESIAELDVVLHKFRKLLRPANIGAATLKLEHLRRYEHSNAHSHKVLRVASELHKYVESYSDRLSLTQIANVVRGMSSVQYRLPPQLLVRLAAGVVADGGTAVRYAADTDVRDLFYGFGGQGFSNPLFWSQLCAAVLPRLETFDPNTLPALVKALDMAHQLPSRSAAAATSTATASLPRTAPPAPAHAGGGAGGGGSEDNTDRESARMAVASSAAVEISPQVAVAGAAMRLAASSLERLQPGRLADTAGLLVTVAPQLSAVQVDEQLVAKLQAAAMPFLPSFNANQLTTLLLGLLYLRQAAATGAASLGVQVAAPVLPLPGDFLAAVEPHLRAAAPTMQLLHIKRAVQALAPSALAQGLSAPSLVRTLNLLARRAALLLPSAPELATGAPRLLTHGALARLPRGGKGAGAVLAVAAPAGDPRIALDLPLMGLLEGLVRAYSCAMGVAGGCNMAAAAAALEEAREARRRQLPDVAELFERVAVVAAAGQARGLLEEAQRASLGTRLHLLLPDTSLALLVPPPAVEASAAVAATGEPGGGQAGH
ncbi:hypothetical protein Vretimale_4763 [Volvox reticuliferus]|uniref:Uncharacterized protein n=1 Tax=Volvox reticuliferus TaxID=1737510 RepID=A0A8J4C0T7_9CHLO|nr:hypothetical protein Vretifemale_3366 [Volvox reticuliferus]GIL99646.1 hypothetical protein Vretimale_4763 [Volvox reticuliferus]